MANCNCAFVGHSTKSTIYGLCMYLFIYCSVLTAECCTVGVIWHSTAVQLWVGSAVSRKPIELKYFRVYAIRNNALHTVRGWSFLVR